MKKGVLLKPLIVPLCVILVLVVARLLMGDTMEFRLLVVGASHLFWLFLGLMAYLALKEAGKKKAAIIALAISATLTALSLVALI